jgi:DNA polymerase-3 subunit epsilon
VNWLGRLLRRRPALHPELALALAAYHARPAVAGSAVLAELRFVVVDVETTGLDPFADRLISIGAVEVIAGKLRLSSGFEVVFRQSQESTRNNILVHGIDGSTQRSGSDPAEAMLRFLDYAERSPLVGFHANFDRIMIERAAREALGSVPVNPWLDLAFLAPALLCRPQQAPPQGLDGWMSFAGIINESRHNALADALSTAQLLQIVLVRAHAAGAVTLDDLMKIEKDQRWLGREA